MPKGNKSGRYPQIEQYVVRLDAVHNISKQYCGKDVIYKLWQGREGLFVGSLADCVQEYGKRAGVDLKALRVMLVKYFKGWQK